MNSKYSNISKWVFGALALITVVMAGLYFYKGVGECKDWLHWLRFDRSHGQPEPGTPTTDLFHTWSYIKVALGVVLILISALFTAIVKGVKAKKLIALVVVIAVNAVLAYLMSKGAIGQDYALGKRTIESPTPFWVEFGLNFFYITFAESILVILYSVVYKAIKK